MGLKSRRGPRCDESHQVGGHHQKAHHICPQDMPLFHAPKGCSEWMFQAKLIKN